MVIVLMLVFVVTIPGSFQLDYNCFTDGSINITNPDETRFKYFYSSVGRENRDCRGGYSDDFRYLLLENCTLGSSITIVFLSDFIGLFTSSNFVGPYQITCEDIPLEGVISNTSVKALVRDNSSIPTETRNISGTPVITGIRNVSHEAVNASETTTQDMTGVTEQPLGVEESSTSAGGSITSTEETNNEITSASPSSTPAESAGTNTESGGTSTESGGTSTDGSTDG